MKIGSQLKAIRLAKGLKITDLADSIESKSVWRVESGTNVRIDNLVKYCDCLGVKIEFKEKQ